MARPGVTLDEGDFVSLDVPPTSAFVGLTGTAAYALLTDGRYASLLRLAPGSEARDAGTDLGATYSGVAPDLGAFESSP